MDFPCAAKSCIVFTVLLLIMAASCVHAQLHAPQLTAISWGGSILSWRNYTSASIQPKNLQPAPRRTAKEITDAQPDEAWQTIIWRESSSCPLSKQFHAGTGCARHSQTHGRSWAGPEGGSLANDRGLGRKEIPHGFSVAYPLRPHWNGW